jgi:hypothetical protein
VVQLLDGCVNFLQGFSFNLGPFFCCLRFGATRCWCPKWFCGALRISLQVALLGTLCSKLVASLCKAEIRSADFSWRVEQLSSVTVSNWRRSTACGFNETAFALLPLLRSAPSSTSFNCVWNSRQVASILTSILYLSLFQPQFSVPRPRT